MLGILAKCLLTDDRREFYMSEILGKAIYDNYGHKVGRVRDLVTLWTSGYPRVTGIKFTNGGQIIPLDRVVEFGLNGVFLTERPRLTMVRPITENEIYVNRWLLDKQVVDIKGAKVVRVNDIKLRWEKLNDEMLVDLIAVDIGMRGLVRRLGFHRWCERFSEHLLDCLHFKPLEARTANLMLSMSQQELVLLHPADIADILEILSRSDQTQLIRSLTIEKAAETLAEVEPETRSRLLEKMDSEEVSALVQAMGPDEAADVLGDLSDNKSQEILGFMEPEDAREVRELMDYPDGTAGSMMTTEVVTISASLTAQETIEKLREMAPSAETIYYVYIIDENSQLLGVLSLRELIVTAPETPISQILHGSIVALDPLADFDKVLELTLKYDFLALPVISQNNQVLGIVTVDDVLERLLADREQRRTAEKFSYLMFSRSLKPR